MARARLFGSTLPGQRTRFIIIIVRDRWRLALGAPSCPTRPSPASRASVSSPSTSRTRRTPRGDGVRLPARGLQVQRPELRPLTYRTAAPRSRRSSCVQAHTGRGLDLLRDACGAAPARARLLGEELVHLGEGPMPVEASHPSGLLHSGGGAGSAGGFGRSGRGVESLAEWDPPVTPAGASCRSQWQRL